MVPGKVPLYLEGDNPDTASESAANVGVEITDGEARLAYVPGAAAVTPALRERLARADVDPVRRHALHRRRDDPHRHRRQRPAAAWATCRSTAGRLARGAGRAFPARRIFVHINNTNPILIDGSPERAPRRGRRLGGRGGRHGDRAVKLLTPDELEAALRDIGARRYHRLHPFHKLLHGGKCTKGQVQAWALNRYYYQSMIPIKDASLIARCDDSAIRREWRSRLVDHDGEGAGRRRHRALAAADRRARPRPRIRDVAARAAAGDALCGRCLCALRAREDACSKPSPRR